MEQKIFGLENALLPLYREREKELLFHGWHHIMFVRRKGKKFARDIGANEFIVESAALVHDLNYLVAPNSEPELGKNLRLQLLNDAGYSAEEVEKIESIVREEHTRTRNTNISEEGKALSDADTLFKALPITPILFSSKYIQENHIDIAKLSKKICEEQNHLLESGIYFYTAQARQEYLAWAKTNLELWNNVEIALSDDDVKEMLEIASKAGVI